MTKRIMKYNPAFLSDEELIESFVVRHADLDLIINTISENVTESNQHVLVIGPRGSGKTTLVRRIALETSRTERLNTLWYPLIFAEESYKAENDTYNFNIDEPLIGTIDVIIGVSGAVGASGSVIVATLTGV